ncbi:MAG: arylsulfatase [Cyclobacteriaceae bacterium]
MKTFFNFHLISVVLFVLSSCNNPTKPPNVVIVIIDDQGYGDMSCNGNPYLQTKAIDELYSSSVVFENFHVDPVCAPTRAALLTGQYSASVGVYMTYMGRHHLRMEDVTLADVFTENGYKTAIFGKWHLGDNYPFRPSDRGFQESLVHGGGAIGETPDYWGNDYYDDVYLRNDTLEQQTGYCTDVWFSEAKEFVKKNKDNPFFLYLSTNSPHGPLRVPEQYIKPFLGQPDISEERAWFYGMIANVDENLGAFRDFLSLEGLSENTIFIFMTDNGTRHGFSPKDKSGFNAGMRATKGSPYDGGHRVPLLIHWPAGGLDKHQKINELTAHFDLFPTLIDLLGFDSNEDMTLDGMSLSPLIMQEKSKWPERKLIVQNQVSFGQKLKDDLPVKYKKYAVMTDQWRLVGDELYDIKNDPGQKHDIAEEHFKVAKELKSHYESWWSELESTFEMYNSTIIGDPAQKEVTLSSQFWHGDYVPYNQYHIRNGMKANGYWDIEIAQSGNYEIVLRRWPEVLSMAMNDSPMDASIDTTRFYKGDKFNSPINRSIEVIAARLKVGDFDRTESIRDGQKMATFTVPLTRGKHYLKTWLIDSSADSVGAYYVSLKLIEQ